MSNIVFKAPPVDFIETGKKTHEHLIADKAGFEKLAEIVKDLTGISLPNNEKNRTLMAGRVHSLMSKYQYKTYAELATKLMSGNKTLQESFISCLTTNTTHFFREGAHYDVLKKYLQERMAVREFTTSSFRVWCSAASSGQEPYSILMTLLSGGFPIDRQALEFLATDIDLEILKKASQANYSEEEIKTVPPEMKQAYFQPIKDKTHTTYKVLPQFRKMINFARFNLIQDKPAFKEKFDVIFCRNVLIYFEKEVSTAVIDMLISQLKPGGLIFLGHVETGLLKNKNVRPISHAVYKKV
ncbi:CheR family methyltransferase [Peredibacter starrii]|uniref:protein-glutamate O-methyltransferase n=1 Tax=Peredibacter starrii TaxID=28202 RepID=A0AAX4HNZ8_9BACT|nr:protein-glutamate O-methyltransferase CheR [Peredibacter starrii]WPU65083.1 protein-glutamate O-methyltransferase CheR [Peredibacter starrii]